MKVYLLSRKDPGFQDTKPLGVYKTKEQAEAAKPPPPEYEVFGPKTMYTVVEIEYFE